jgi:hypothetical protein
MNLTVAAAPAGYRQTRLGIVMVMNGVGHLAGSVYSGGCPARRRPRYYSRPACSL